MRSIVLFAVLVALMLGSVRKTEAGVILRELTVAKTIESGGKSLSPVSESSPQGDDQSRNVRQDDFSGMAGNSVSGGQIVNFLAATWGLQVAPARPVFCGTLTLANAALPSNPVLYGLLKPS